MALLLVLQSVLEMYIISFFFSVGINIIEILNRKIENYLIKELKTKNRKVRAFRGKAKTGRKV
jgi:hypothetical protein